MNYAWRAEKETGLHDKVFLSSRYFHWPVRLENIAGLDAWMLRMASQQGTRRTGDQHDQPAGNSLF